MCTKSCHWRGYSHLQVNDMKDWICKTLERKLVVKFFSTVYHNYYTCMASVYYFFSTTHVSLVASILVGDMTVALDQASTFLFS